MLTSPVSVLFFNKGNSQNSSVTLSGVQFRGQSLYSDFEVPLSVEALEYAWLVELIFGEIKGKINLKNVMFLKNFLLKKLKNLPKFYLFKIFMDVLCSCSLFFNFWIHF